MGEQVENRPLVSGDTIAGGIMNIAGTAINNMFAQQREANARAENYEYNEKAAENAYQRQLNYYDTRMSPAALLAQYRDAGLSPSLMFGGGGVGGGSATAPQGQGSSGVSPNIFGMNLLESAQVGLMQAQTRKLNAEADTEEGTNERGRAEIENILKDTAKKFAETGNIEIETKINELTRDLKNKTFWTDVATAENKCAELNASISEKLANVRLTDAQAEQLEKAMYDNLRNIKAQADKAEKEIILTEENIKLTKEQIANIKQATQKLIYDINYDYQRVLIEQRNATTAEKNAETQRVAEKRIKWYQKELLRYYSSEQSREMAKTKATLFVSTINALVGGGVMGALTGSGM